MMTFLKLYQRWVDMPTCEKEFVRKVWQGQINRDRHRGWVRRMKAYKEEQTQP